jgi:hypothetical protein
LRWGTGRYCLILKIRHLRFSIGRFPAWFKQKNLKCREKNWKVLSIACSVSNVFNIHRQQYCTAFAKEFLKHVYCGGYFTSGVETIEMVSAQIDAVCTLALSSNFFHCFRCLFLVAFCLPRTFVAIAIVWKKNYKKLELFHTIHSTS